ncbi:GNAT family N-acetyltransferase [Rubrivirga sp.]|uniref:GNAT family N-acetyltransferase n=1 Tax=Rubrivirga sp. TaxID=1885344 RepID=UPI003B527043
MEPHVRLATPGDEPFLWTALYHALHVPPGAEPFPAEAVRRPEIARYVAGWMGRPGDLGVVAEVGGVPVGAAWLRRWPASDRGFGFVDQATPELSMALLPGHRGRGVGTTVLRRLLAEARRESDAVSLSVSESNPALQLYRRLGFVVVGESKGGSVTMRKALTS